MKMRAFYKILPLFIKKKLSIVIYKKTKFLEIAFYKKSIFGKNIHPWITNLCTSIFPFSGRLPWHSAGARGPLANCQKSRLLGQTVGIIKVFKRALSNSNLQVHSRGRPCARYVLCRRSRSWNGHLPGWLRGPTHSPGHVASLCYGSLQYTVHTTQRSFIHPSTYSLRCDIRLRQR